MIQQKVEPDYNPRRLLRMVMMDMREEAFSSPTTWMCSACDLCYSSCPQEIHISSVIAAVKELAVQNGYSSPLSTVSVNEEKCSGCGICVMACPYEAPHLIEEEVNGQIDRFAEVDINRCMGCGTCVAACPMGAIAREGVANEDILPQIHIQTSLSPALVVFICDWCLRVEEDESILESYPDNVRVIHIPCSGRIDPQMAVMALAAGIDGVLVCGCAPGECHYKRGNYVSQCKMGLLDKLFDQFVLPQKRARFVQLGTQDRGRIRQEIDTMLSSLEIPTEVA
jgi:coenzyme F420-reducing hydrogenase delta subunit/NAD-dependent dihydropyrimidine dehydrogenase PreA subunit